jgi:hypothetical protein
VTQASNKVRRWERRRNLIKVTSKPPLPGWDDDLLRDDYLPPPGDDWPPLNITYRMARASAFYMTDEGPNEQTTNWPSNGWGQIVGPAQGQRILKSSPSSRTVDRIRFAGGVEQRRKSCAFLGVHCISPSLCHVLLIPDQVCRSGKGLAN